MGQTRNYISGFLFPKNCGNGDKSSPCQGQGLEENKNHHMMKSKDDSKI